MNYDSANGITVYINGQEMGSDTDSTGGQYTPSDGRMFVGILWTHFDEYYGSLMMDELTFWNRKLDLQEIVQLNN